MINMVKTLTLVLLLGLSHIVFATTPAYDSLEHFCLATNADTAENCACGQVKADELLSAEEQQLVIRLMTQDPAAMGKVIALSDQGQSLMEKVDQITQGCDS